MTTSSQNNTDHGNTTPTDPAAKIDVESSVHADNVADIKPSVVKSESVTAINTAAVPSPRPVQDEVKGPASLHAVKGDHRVTNQASQTVAVVDDPKTKWAQLIGPAKLFWGKLTEAELQKTEGNEHRLATLVQGRYDIPRGDAYRQVKSFHAKQIA